MGKRGNKNQKTAANPCTARLPAVSPQRETRGNNGKHGATNPDKPTFSHETLSISQIYSVFFWETKETGETLDRSWLR